MTDDRACNAHLSKPDRFKHLWSRAQFQLLNPPPVHRIKISVRAFQQDGSDTGETVSEHVFPLDGSDVDIQVWLDGDYDDNMSAELYESDDTWDGPATDFPEDYEIPPWSDDGDDDDLITEPYDDSDDTWDELSTDAPED